jgi:glycosyltransferase involved in cell wall biosynthesis
VLYIEPRVWVVRYVWQNLRRPIKIVKLLKKIVSTQRVDPEGQRLYLKSQWNLIPGSREVGAIAKFNHWLNRPLVNRAIKKLGFKQGNVVMWIYDTEAAEYLPIMDGVKVLYDCVDNHAAQAGVNRNPKRVEEEERAILARVDIVTVTSRRLLKDIGKKNKNVHLVLNAGDVELYSRDSGEVAGAVKKITRPVVGMVGALDEYKVDFELLLAVAKEKQEWNFVFVGKPVVDRRSKLLKKLEKLPNVHLLGQIDRKEVPQYVYGFDVCIIPYRASRYNEASFPLKFWEFMATGKPIVVTGLPELGAYKSMVGYAKKKKDFIALTENYLKSPGRQSQERKREAKRHSWDKRLSGILKIIKEYGNKS